MFSRITSRKKGLMRGLGALLTVVCVNVAAYESDATSVPWPGKMPVRVVSIESPLLVNITFESWPGFWLKFRINVPGIAVPEDTPQASDCERELAARAMTATEQFLKGAKQVYIHDMKVVTTTDPDGYAQISADPGGDLAAALKREGLARPDSIDPDQPWCEK